MQLPAPPTNNIQIRLILRSDSFRLAPSLFLEPLNDYTNINHQSLVGAQQNALNLLGPDN